MVPRAVIFLSGLISNDEYDRLRAEADACRYLSELREVAARWGGRVEVTPRPKPRPALVRRALALAR